jgi:tetratricopeptide (TPR) repeat protein
MTTRLICLTVLVLVLCACSGASATPTPTATAIPTDTAAPTHTPTPEPSPTPKPTATTTPSPAPTATPTPTQGLTAEELSAFVVAADTYYKSGDYANALVIYNDLVSAVPDPTLRVLRADTYDRLGNFEAAIADYLVAVDLGFNEEVIPKTVVHNNLCWDLGITGQPEKALPYCEQAVEAEPSSQHRDSRGVTYAQLGKFEEASADFQAVVDDLKGATDPTLKAIAAERQEWLKVLKAGKNPITPEVLAKLRAETSSVAATPTPDANAVTRSSVQEAARKAGFTFGEVDTSGSEEILTGNFVEGSCKVIVTLVGSETHPTRATLQATDCLDAEQAGQATWFATSLVPEEYFMAAMMYASLDLYPIIEGNVDTVDKKEIGDVIFETKRTGDSKQTLEITANFK